MNKFWIDTHCHVNYMENQGEVLQRASKNNVKKIVCVSTDLVDTDKILKVVELGPENGVDVYRSIGMHPLHCDKYTIDEINEYLNNCNLDKVVAVGETGLDDFRSEFTQIQIDSFECHIDFAIKKNLPIVMHTRSGSNSKVEQEAIRILKQYDVSGIAHCFNGSPEFAQFLIEKGWYISFSGIITYRNTNVLKTIASSVPIDQILVETDAPFLPPEGQRGKQNEPANVVHVGREIAKIRSAAGKVILTEEEIMSITSENAMRVFGI